MLGVAGAGRGRDGAAIGAASGAPGLGLRDAARFGGVGSRLARLVGATVAASGARQSGRDDRGGAAAGGRRLGDRRLGDDLDLDGPPVGGRASMRSSALLSSTM